jgi:hypothetical protein
MDLFRRYSTSASGLPGRSTDLQVTTIDDLVALVKTRLRRMQYRPDLLDGFLGQTRLTLQPGQTRSTRSPALQPL